MIIHTLSQADYSALERDLCALHRREADEDRITAEWNEIAEKFRFAFSRMRKEKIPDWHNNIRMFWTCLYTSEFYVAKFPRRIQEILRGAGTQWFAQFECYSSIPPAGEAVGDRYLGHFIIYKESIIMSESFASTKFRELMAE